MEPERRKNLRRAEDALAWKRFRNLERLVVALVVIQLISGVVSVYLVTQNSQRSNDIQQSRHDNVVRACHQENDHNAAAVLFLSELPQDSGEPKRSPREQADLIQRFANALVGPVVKDCEKYAEEQVGH
jgi:hypothetical protein